MFPPFTNSLQIYIYSALSQIFFPRKQGPDEPDLVFIILSLTRPLAVTNFHLSFYTLHLSRRNSLADVVLDPRKIK